VPKDRPHGDRIKAQNPSDDRRFSSPAGTKKAQGRAAGEIKGKIAKKQAILTSYTHSAREISNGEHRMPL
jgi:hypothetical protein